MKVGYVVSSKGHGRGGHFYSLKTTAEALSERIDPVIVNVGIAESPVLNSFRGRKIDVLFKDSSLKKHVTRVCDALSAIRPDVIHSFDLDALFFARAAATRLGVPLVHTKCGGPIPNGYFPAVRELIVYSEEDLAWFKRSARHQETRINVIPNRVLPVEQDFEAIGRLRERLPKDKLVLLRICRVSPYYRKSLIQAARLVRELSSREIPIQLLVVGVVEDPSIQREVEGLAAGHATFASEEDFSVNAARIIEVADMVMGTGRSFMEAASLGKTMLAPVANASIPVLVDIDRVDLFRSRNFSERVTLESFDEGQEIERIRLACVELFDGGFKEGLLAFARENFDVRSRVEDFCSIYRTAKKPDRVGLFDLALHTFLVVRRHSAARNAMKQRFE